MAAAQPPTWLAARTAWFRCGQVTSCSLLGASVVCATLGLTSPWLAITVDRGILSGSGEFTLWNVTIGAQVGEVDLPQKVVGNDDNLCNGEAAAYGIKIPRHVCEEFGAIRWNAVLTLGSVLLAFLVAVAFTVSSYMCAASRMLVAWARLVLPVSSASAAYFATSALVHLYLLSRSKMHLPHVEKQVGRGALCVASVAVLTCLAVCMQLATFCSLRYDTEVSQGVGKDNVELKEGEVDPAQGDEAC